MIKGLLILTTLSVFIWTDITWTLGPGTFAFILISVRIKAESSSFKWDPNSSLRLSERARGTGGP